MSSAKKTTILFVDDEPNILSGLKRMLRSMRKSMTFYFAENGHDALTVMATENIDIIVSDMRMPGMDGATLLTTVQQQYPQAIRIMLTGHADEKAIMRTIGVVHQFLAKPAEPATLKRVLERAAALQNLMNDDHLKQLVSGIGSLPSMPETYARLQRTLQRSDSSLAEVAHIIEQDLAMSAKILQLVNSAFFGLYNHIESPFRAVNLLGMDTVKALVLGIGVFSEIQAEQSKLFAINDLWTHSMTTAAFARGIAACESNDNELIDNAFIAGLLHDIGKLLLFSQMRSSYEKAVGYALETPSTMDNAEQKIFGACHGDIGGYLIGLWGLPGPVVESITFHHRLENYPEPSFCPAVIVHAADYIYYRLHPDSYPGKPPQLNEPVLQQIGMIDHQASWTELCREILTRGEDNDQ